MTKEELKSHRELLGLSVTQIADRIGVTRKTYLSYERGVTKPPRSIELLLSYIFGIEPPPMTVISKKRKTPNEVIADTIVKRLAPYLVNLESRLVEMKCEIESVAAILEIDKDGD